MPPNDPGSAGPTVQAVRKTPVAPFGRLPVQLRGGRIAHMVSLVHADDKWFAILDNNFPGSIEWMSPEEFKRTYTGGRAGWAVLLLNPGPPPPPCRDQSR